MTGSLTGNLLRLGTPCDRHVLSHNFWSAWRSLLIALDLTLIQLTLADSSTCQEDAFVFRRRLVIYQPRQDDGLAQEICLAAFREAQMVKAQATVDWLRFFANALDLTNLSAQQYLSRITRRHTCTMGKPVSHTTPHSALVPSWSWPLASSVLIVPVKFTLVADPDRILGILTLGQPVLNPGSDIQQGA